MENAFNIVLLTRPVTGAITYAQCLSKLELLHDICASVDTACSNIQVATRFSLDFHSDVTDDLRFARLCCKSHAYCRVINSLMA